MRFIDRHKLRKWAPWIAGAGTLVLLVFLVWYWLRPRSSPLDLIAYDTAGRFGQDVSLILSEVTGTGNRVPLLLALRNPGTSAARAGAILLFLPSWLRLETDSGVAIVGEGEGGNPLIGYRIALDGVRVEPARFPTVIPERERLWLRPFTSPYRCALDDEGRPIFTSAPSLNPSLLSQVTLFWVIQEAGSSRRSTGTLKVRMDPRLFEVQAGSRPLTYAPSALAADAPRPNLNALPVEGRVTAACGDMVEPLTLESTVYRAGDAGRIITLAVADSVKRVLFDLDGDDTIEVEAWDEARSGRLDTARRARYAVPGFLLPSPPPMVDTAAADSSEMAVDTVQAAVQDTMARPQ
jgi:hypothetical protein